MYRKKAHIHFVGIGGIGMSAIATIVRHQGYTVSGCDLDLEQKSIHDLHALGCTIYEGNNTSACHDTNIDILVYSSAIKRDDPEIVAAQQRGIPTIARALMLAELMRTKYSIAIAGAHGKTTTTSLISHILIEAERDPTVIIGGHLHTISSNARMGKGDFLVAEADESDRSFLYLHATLAVVTNIDLEHLETYKDLDDIKRAFTQFLDHVPFYGKAFVCNDDPHLRSLLPIPHIKTVRYGITHDDADLKSHTITLLPESSIFSVTCTRSNQELGTVTLAMPGMHNILNALAAIAVTRDLDVPFATIARALATFKGVDRRFSYRGTFKGALVFDDYGHHPNEIINTLRVARHRSPGKLTVVFQPHRYTRTHALWQEFLTTFLQSPLDELIITDIYPASEQPITGVTSAQLVQDLQAYNPPFKVTYVPFNATMAHLVEKIALAPEDLILFLGAGKVTKLASQLATHEAS